ncbi:unnamed protein product [Spirodela intermedia]|uniref:Uncharacterized protein n=1 Tax=Spirodela intermedia TaxID=51605 RepID=A0A7I8LDK9_SPIIN|nr:unnamed protein product [Spirodela intermedia]
MKKARAAPAEAALPHHPYPVISEDDRAWFKLQHLKQDYEDLQKDAAVKRRRLTMARQRARKLNDEVRFLRRRYKFLIQNASPIPYKLKTRPQKTSNALKLRERRSPIRVDAVGRDDGSHTAEEATLPKTSGILDLNQISLPEGEEAEFQSPSEAPPMESSRRYLPEGDAVPSGGSRPPLAESSSRRRTPEGDLPGGLLKSPICRDAGGGGGSSRRGKRKVSWQDQVALKV